MYVCPSYLSLLAIILIYPKIIPLFCNVYWPSGYYATSLFLLRVWAFNAGRMQYHTNNISFFFFFFEIDA